MIKLHYVVKVYDGTGKARYIEDVIVGETDRSFEQMRADVEDYLEQFSGEVILFEEIKDV